MSRLGVRNGFRRPKSFKSLKWKKHRIIDGAIQGKLTLSNGIEFSVVAGPTLYSLPKEIKVTHLMILINLRLLYLIKMVSLWMMMF